LKVPEAEGVPNMVIKLPFQEAATPAGSPLAPIVPAFAIPVAPVVVCVIFVRDVLIQTDGVDEATPKVLVEETVTAKVCAVLVPHELVAVTETFPFCPDAPTVTVIEFVPVPAVIDQPVGTVHV
jgi:hypothetical protein